MVKIKEGYVMTPREQVEYDRMNALPRKTSGRVDYYFKPQTKYPPRIYVFMHAEIWCDRNRRPMGLFHALPFISRPMNKEEIEYHHFNTRLCYHQYEDLEKLLHAEEQEAAELDKECPGRGAAFLEELAGLRAKYPLGSKLEVVGEVKPAVVGDGLSAFLGNLMARGDSLTAAEISRMMDQEQAGEKRPAVLILLRELYKNTVLPPEEKAMITEAVIDRKVFLSQERSRKNYVRRVFRFNKLFALEEIKGRYSEYTEAMLMVDLKVKKGKAKRKKHKPVLDLRRCQLLKLGHRLQYGELCEGEYHAAGW
ncbi:hypothetical protein MUGA111182_17855 [Mucilaginibacter galii]|uniref:Uncharacterized protein n=1 Tax=Mucilaginibacter galii TaxID=2005073 RepID=A0A917JBZ5_9SPHI|nr:hypothetical protein [Mucilaginibacter galii]GGI52426.1 hypothetical protein GCM10011425_36380 [Mucilaginibacter galii]